MYTILSRFGMLVVLREGVANLVEGVGQLVADGGDGGDDDNRDQAGDEAVFDGGGTGVVASSSDAKEL
jgi:hypothetical protein